MTTPSSDSWPRDAGATTTDAAGIRTGAAEKQQRQEAAQQERHRVAPHSHGVLPPTRSPTHLSIQSGAIPMACARLGAWGRRLGGGRSDQGEGLCHNHCDVASSSGPLRQSHMELTAFSEEDFDAKAWVNAACARCAHTPSRLLAVRAPVSLSNSQPLRAAAPRRSRWSGTSPSWRSRSSYSQARLSAACSCPMH